MEKGLVEEREKAIIASVQAGVGKSGTDTLKINYIANTEESKTEGTDKYAMEDAKRLAKLERHFLINQLSHHNG